jgi:hypothetical protein
MMWVQSVDEATESRARLDIFKELYETVKHCESTACIEEGITRAQNMPSFKEEYLEAKAASDESTNLADDKKDDLILCGFRHAIEALEENLKREE